MISANDEVGNGGGSLVVNDKAWSHLRDELNKAKDGIDAVLRKLEMSLEECQHQVSKQVDEIKIDFDSLEVYWIELAKPKGDERLTKSVLISRYARTVCSTCSLFTQ